MALLTIKLVGVIIALTMASKSKSSVANTLPSSGTSSSKFMANTQKGNSMLSRLLQEHLDKALCGIPHPKCTTECFDEDGCVCLQKMGYFSGHKSFPCKENYKICWNGEYKSFNYSKIDPLHIAAQHPNEQCDMERQGVTDEEKQQILHIHNNFRAKVARGEETRSAQQGVSQPSGSNIKELIWNEELAYIAQAWANQCDGDYEQDTNSSRRVPCSRIYDYVGMSLYSYLKPWADSVNQWPKFSNSFSPRWIEAIEGWYEEVADTPISVVSSYDSAASTEMIGNYTQIMWAETYEIGCGAVYYSGSKHGYGSTTLYVCNYGPGGNVFGGRMYKIGEAASDCGEPGKSTQYPGLCAPEH